MANLIVCAGTGVDVSGVPEEIKILPLGRVHSQKGDFTVDDESFELIQRQFKNRRLDLVIDYEHQTLEDVQAPAAGWIKELYKGTDAIIAKVEWTQKGAEYLKNKEYKYLSPVVLVRKKDQKAAVLHSAALTNTPAIDGMFPLVNAVHIDELTTEGGKIMDLKELAKLLGLPEDATEEDIKKAVAAGQKAKEEQEKKEEPKTGQEKPPEQTEVVANSTILSMLGLKTDARTEDVAASIMELKAGGMDVQQELLALKERLEEQEAEEMVKEALKAGKITAAQKEWAKTYALKDREGFKGFMDKAPVVVPVGKMELQSAPENDQPEVDPMILKACGITKEDVEKYGARKEW